MFVAAVETVYSYWTTCSFSVALNTTSVALNTTRELPARGSLEQGFLTWGAEINFRGF